MSIAPAGNKNKIDGRGNSPGEKDSVDQPQMLFSPRPPLPLLLSTDTILYTVQD